MDKRGGSGGKRRGSRSRRRGQVRPREQRGRAAREAEACKGEKGGTRKLAGNEDEEMAMVTPRHDVSLRLPAKHTCQ